MRTVDDNSNNRTAETENAASTSISTSNSIRTFNQTSHVVGEKEKNLIYQNCQNFLINCSTFKYN